MSRTAFKALTDVYVLYLSKIICFPWLLLRSFSFNEFFSFIGNADIRLVGGSDMYEGRLEVNYEGDWGTVCDDYFDSVDAVVACRQLGLPT